MVFDGNDGTQGPHRFLPRRLKFSRRQFSLPIPRSTPSPHRVRQHPKPPRSGRPRPASPSATPAARGPPSTKPATRSSSAGATSKRSKPRPPRSTPPRWTPRRCGASPTHCSRSTRPAPPPPRGTAANAPTASSNCGRPRPPSHPSPAPGGRPTTRSPNTLTTIVPVRGARTAGDANTARALRTITAAAGSGSLKAQAFRLLQTL